VGASYGGYAALAGVAFTSDIYACAVSVNGVSNLPEMLGWEAAHHGSESNSVGYWKDSIGSKGDPMVAARSPARAAGQVRAPVMLIYCADDTVVPNSQSQEMAQALKLRGTPYSVVKLDGDDHWLSRTDTRVQMLKTVEGFLAESLRK
jgi:dipeptidyl aminopeptidase/acylaminoacyl peptidase